MTPGATNHGKGAKQGTLAIGSFPSQEKKLILLIHIYGVRATLEIEAAPRGAANVTDSDVARMEAACARMQKAVAERRVWDALDDDEDLLRNPPSWKPPGQGM
jgi:DNA-binding FadR family transcriptional regulator